MPRTYTIAWWNLENLFDEENAQRTDKVRRALGNSIVGWTPQLRDRKISQLGSIIVQMNNGAGPDLLGVCEVENRNVLDLLEADIFGRIGRHYAIAHFDTVDQRGIDIAFLFDSNLFTAPPDERFMHVVMRRTATREIFQVNFQTTHGNRTWAVFGNHWPSRRGGTLESAGYRAIAGETLAYFHQRVLEVHGDTTPVLAMGDFNDEPFDRSLDFYALSSRQRTKVINGTSPRLWNQMWPLLEGDKQGTFFFDNFANLLDQFLVNKNMARATSPIRAEHATVQIFSPPEMVHGGDYPRPIPFGGLGKPVDQNGFSDHYPILMQVVEAD